MAIPVGTVVAYAGAVGAQQKTLLLAEGWALCDGSTLMRASFPLLYEALGFGQIYGAGDGANTFHLPDYRGRFLRGVDDPDSSGGINAAGNDPDAAARVHAVSGQQVGGSVGTLQASATASLAGVTDGGHFHPWSHMHVGGAFAQLGSDVEVPTTQPLGMVDGEHAHESIAGGVETRPANIAINWLIKALPN
jgi:microcystin-dependent protein